jgi:hypothetical protein
VKVPLSAFCAIGFAALVGCSRSPYVPVTGRVTLDGNPLPNALVEFHPENLRCSFGTTNENGEYRLVHLDDSAGARIGVNTVRIRTAGFTEDLRAVERVPKKYNSESILIREVTADSTTFDFELTTR